MPEYINNSNEGNKTRPQKDKEICRYYQYRKGAVCIVLATMNLKIYPTILSYYPPTFASHAHKTMTMDTTTKELSNYFNLNMEGRKALKHLSNVQDTSYVYLASLLECLVSQTAFFKLSFSADSESRFGSYFHLRFHSYASTSFNEPSRAVERVLSLHSSLSF